MRPEHEAYVKQGVEAFMKLQELAPKLNIAYDNLRVAASELAGCSLESLSLEELEWYVNVALTEYRKQLPEVLPVDEWI